MREASAWSASAHGLLPNACQEASSTPSLQDVISNIKYSFKHDPVQQQQLPVLTGKSFLFQTTFLEHPAHTTELHHHQGNFLSYDWKLVLFVQASKATV